MRLETDPITRFARLLFTLCLAIAWSGRPQQLMAQAAEASSGPGPTSAPAAASRAKLDQLARQTEQYFAALEAQRDQILADTFDVHAVLAQVGSEPAKLFEWVRDNTCWVPYLGLLRGDKGVLMDRLGNSLDRSLLLYVLLRRSDKDCRLAHAELGDETARGLLSRLSAARVGTMAAAATSQPASASDEGQALDQMSRQYGFDRAELQALAEKINVASQRLGEDLLQRSSDQTSAIGAGVAPAPAAQPPRQDDRGSADRWPDTAENLTALRDHWWVQLKQPDGSWLDLDPLLAGASAGSRVAEPTETLQPAHYADLGQDRLHTVQVQVTVEYLDAQGKLEEHAIVARRLLPAAVLGQRIVVRQVPMNWPKDLKLLGAPDVGERLKAAALQQHEWLAALCVGEETVEHFAFTDDGELKDATLPGYAQAMNGAQGTGNAVKGMLGGGGLGGGLGARRGTEPRQAGPKQLTAEWIDYQVSAPGQQKRHIRRELFDCLGPAARQAANDANHPTPPKLALSEAQRLNRNLALLGETEILPLMCQPSPQFVQRLALEKMLRNRKVLAPALEAQTSSYKAFESCVSSLEPLPGPLYALAAARMSMPTAETRLFLDRLNLFSLHVGLSAKTDGALAVSGGFDIVCNELAVAGQTDPQRAFLARLRQGVIDGNAESLILGAAASGRTSAVSCAASLMASLPPESWTLLRGATDRDALAKLDLPADIRTRVAQDLAAGYHVLVPSKGAGPTLAWWRIDPASGSTLAIGARGWGEAGVEHSLVKAVVVISVVVFALCAFGALTERSDGVEAAFDVALCAVISGVTIVMALNAPHAALWLGILELVKVIAELLKEWRSLFHGEGAEGGHEGAGGGEGGHPGPVPTGHPTPTATPDPSKTNKGGSSGGGSTGGSSSHGPYPGGYGIPSDRGNPIPQLPDNRPQIRNPLPWDGEL